MSFLKYKRDLNERNVHWSRASLDGAPFRGGALPILKDREFDDATERVFDVRYGTFDTSDPTQKLPEHAENPRSLETILDCAANDWFKILRYNERWVDGTDGKPTIYVFVIWAEPYMELATENVPRSF